MSNSNVIQVNFAARRESKEKAQAITYSNLIDDVMANTNDLDEWPEDLTPRERCDQLQKDLEFLRKMNEVSSLRKY